MKKIVKIIIFVVILIIVLFVGFWSAMIVTDTVKSQNLQEPVFAKEIRVEADNDIIVYQGLGYTIERAFFANQNGESYCGESEVYLFGNLVAAVIT